MSLNLSVPDFCRAVRVIKVIELFTVFFKKMSRLNPERCTMNLFSHLDKCKILFNIEDRSSNSEPRIK